jgi:hypothetical protein
VAILTNTVIPVTAPPMAADATMARYSLPSRVM